MGSRWRIAVPVGVAAVVLYGLIGVSIGYPCARIGVPKGVWLERCPTGKLRLSADVRAESLVRGGEGRVSVAPQLGWLEGDGPTATPRWQAFQRGFSTTLTLRDSDGRDVPGLDVGRFRAGSGAREATVELPAVPDGDYILHAAIDAGFEAIEVDLPLALYAPAVVHVASDRPLYKPGQDVLLRSAVLARTDLAPLEGRPGKWRVWSPAGDEMLVERDAVGPWGIADTTFPLSADADIGIWRAAYESGQARDEVTFSVEPFRLPRFTVALEPSASWYGPSDAIRLAGTARYTSGAPVQDASVTVRVVQTSGGWPIPLEWAEPRTLTTDARGAFAVALGEVPADLVGLAEIAVRATVTDAAGEALGGISPVTLSVDDLVVAAVSELEDGLVAGVNNRVYLRVARPDGVPLRETAIRVRNPWLPDAPVKEARTDVDGVAAIQIDPGPPVTVVQPALPVRVRPLADEPVVLAGASELGRGGGIDLGERRSVDAIQPALEGCVGSAPGPGTATARLRVGRGGGIERVIVDAGEGALYQPVEACLSAAAAKIRFPAGDLRTYELTWSLPQSRGGRLDLDVATSPEIEEALATAALRSRDCLPRQPGSSGGVAYLVHFGTRGRQLSAAVDVLDSLGAFSDGCVSRQFATLSLTEAPETQDELGVARLVYQLPSAPGAAAPRATTRVGYELQITAVAEEQEVGRGRLVLGPGSVPDLRIRATPSLARPGDEVVFDFLRGPSFAGALPDEVWLREGSSNVAKTKVSGEPRKATFTIPADAEGFLSVEYGSARAVVFVQRPDPLSVTMSTDKAVYRPGDTATLTVSTRAGTTPSSAAVSLIGVDSSLAQLAPLLGPDDWGRVTVRVSADRPAFGAFDPRALALGQVHGENAARAAVLRISQIPMDPAGDDRVSAAGGHQADTTTALVDGFWRVQGRTAARTRAWETSAPPGEMLDPPRVVGWWNEALAAEAKEGRAAVDGFGRPLALAVLPADLLAELDPRRLVADATRLPEDDVGWMRYIEEEVR